MALYDLHLHSHYSDGDESVAEVVRQAAMVGLAGVALTDHNGVWGADELREALVETRLVGLLGIEISARLADTDIHILGYSQAWQVSALEAGLATTRAGYEERIAQMVDRCQAAGFTKVTVEEIWRRRAGQRNPSLISYDVTRLLQSEHGLSPAAARELTTPGGTCYVPYGDWALSPVAAVDLIHTAGGCAFLAHPGIVVAERTRTLLDTLLADLRRSGLDGIEAIHPFHSEALQQELLTYARDHHLLISGGSDWHGPRRYHEGAFGRVGIVDEPWQRLLEALA